MTARSEEFPWPSHYGQYDFFELRMDQHGEVASLTAQGNGVYDLTRTQGDKLRVFICECYAFGVAEYMKTVEQLGKLNAVIINSNWCGYSPDAKLHCRRERVGLFSIGAFMAALHRNDYWSFLTAEEQDSFKKLGWL